MKKLLIAFIVLINLFFTACAKSNYQVENTKEIVSHNEHNIFN